MGIKGLHKALSFCTIKDNLRNHRNSIVAVDASSWMHRSVYSISEKFVEATDRDHLDDWCVRVSARYIIARCKELIEIFGMRAVYLVMDGTRIPLKADETHDRDRKRQQNLAEARRLKKSGERWKAEDKYKSCIRIRDVFSKAVMREVKQAFVKYGRVHLVNSPYEADSQLARLVLDGVADAVITEDSDVLVYSAAAHVSFPILFKLDRKTGDCDCIEMDWLLSFNPDEAVKHVTRNNTLEVILRRLASRQAKRRGFGVRLFIQGCILAGCDYTKNIEGIGITNAFKLVRDNSFRDNSSRFRKILESLPNKTKQKININEYEEILAKSEAIFFYHPVLHIDGNIKPLLTPRLSPNEYGDDHHFTDHYPYMSRFKDDWSFLGSISPQHNSKLAQIMNTTVERKGRAPVEPNKTQKNLLSVLTNKRDYSELLSPTQSKVVYNPYKKSKFHNDNGFCKNIIPKRQSNSTEVSGDMTKLLLKSDPRFAKRSFSSSAKETSISKVSKALCLPRAGSSSRTSSQSFGLKKIPVQSFFLPRSTKKQNSNSSKKISTVGSCRFNYDPKVYTTIRETSSAPLNRSIVSEDTVIKDNKNERIAFHTRGDGIHNSGRHNFYDLTNSNVCESNELQDQAINRTRESSENTKQDRAVHHVPPKIVLTAKRKVYNNIDEKLDKPFPTDKVDETEQSKIQNSKYFRKRTAARRVTLECFLSPACTGTSDDVCETLILPKSNGGKEITFLETRGRAEGKGTCGLANSAVDQKREKKTENSKLFSQNNFFMGKSGSPSEVMKLKPHTDFNASKLRRGTSSERPSSFSYSSLNTFFSPRRTSNKKYR